MTKTALENKKLKQEAEIAAKDRALKEKELSHKKDQFKHQKKMDKINTIFGISKQTGDAALKLATVAANDPEWYKRYFTDLSRFTNVATYYRAGTNVLNKLVNPLATYDATPGNRTENIHSYESPAGIAVCEWMPTIGAGPEQGSDLSLSPVNQILMRTKEQVLKSNSRSNTEWDPGDLGFNIVATASILLAIAEYERAVYATQTYCADNAYMPEGLLMALGCNATNWMRDVVDARKYLMLLKKRFNEACVAPRYASIYARYQYLGSSYISDSEIRPQQIYLFKTNGYYQLSADVTHLEYIAPTRSTPYLWYTQISTMIQRITETPDYINMYSDLRSAFGDNLISLDLSFDDSAGLAPNYQADAIEQISSIKTLPVFWYGAVNDEYEVCAPTGFNINQSESGYLYQGPDETDPYLTFSLTLSGTDIAIPGPAFALVKNVNALSQLHNVHKDTVDGDDILDITRWNIVVDENRTMYNDEGAVLHILSSDIAIAMYWRLFKFAKSGSLYTLNSDTIIGTTNLYINVPEANQMMDKLMSATYSFDWMPCIRNILVVNASGVLASTITTTYCEFQHPFIIGLETLSQLNAACVLSEFFIDSDQFKR